MIRTLLEKWAIGLICLLAVPCGPASAQALDRITLNARELSSGGYTWEAPATRIEESLDLGDKIYGGTLNLMPKGRQGQYRVRVQFETSLAIGAEGPHVDLVDFHHCVSEWHLAESDEGGSFIVPTPTEAEAGCVPRATMGEVRTAARKALIDLVDSSEEVDYWLGLIKDLKSPADSPMYSAISEIRIQVEAQVGDRWIPVTLLVFEVPMGC